MCIGAVRKELAWGGVDNGSSAAISHFTLTGLKLFTLSTVGLGPVQQHKLPGRMKYTVSAPRLFLGACGISLSHPKSLPLPVIPPLPTIEKSQESVQILHMPSGFPQDLFVGYTLKRGTEQKLSEQKGQN